MREALRQLGFPEPNNIDIPAELQPFAERRVWRSTLSEVIHKKDQWPVFIKPYYSHKQFTGHVIREFKDLIRTARFDGDFPVLAQEVVDFSVEYRFFVLRKKIVGASFYNGDPLIPFDGKRVELMVKNYQSCPIAYSLDVGVREPGGTTILVEVNDAFSLGCYGLSPNLYAQMIEQRWMELTGTEI